MNTIAIITGASSGLGKEYTKQLLEQNYDEYWLIARRKERLQELKETLSDKIRPIPLDVTDHNDLKKLVDLLDEERPHIMFLADCAGCGTTGAIDEIEREDSNRMIDLNCKAMSEIINITLPFMCVNSNILITGSVAGYQPMPNFAVYGATKAFVESYARAIRYELKPRGINVTVVTPYWIQDTEFIPNAAKHTNGGYNNMFGARSSVDVVKDSLRDTFAKKAVSTPGFVSKTDRVLSKVLPHSLVVPIMRSVCSVNLPEVHLPKLSKKL